MPDENSQAGTPQAGGPAANAQTPPVVPTPQAGGSTATNGTAPAAPPATIEEALAAITRLQAEVTETRKEAAGYRVKAKTLDDAQEAARLAALSDVDRAKAELETAKQATEKLRGAMAASAIAQAAKTLGIIDPELAAKLVQERGGLDLDESGLPKDATAALRALLLEKPYLASTAAIAGATANPSSGGATAGEMSFLESQLQDVDFYVAHEKEIKAAMLKGRIIRGK